MSDEFAVQEITKEALTGDLRFTSEQISPSALGDIVSDRYGKEWLNWTPETTRQTIQRDFVTEINPVNWEKLHAIKLLLLTDDFWHDCNVFAVVVKAFNNLIPNFKFMEECSPGEMAWAVSEAEKIRSETFSDEVILYIRACCHSHGLILFPEQLSFAHVVITSDVQNIKTAWESASKNLSFPVQEDSLGIQLARLNSIRHLLRVRQGESDEVAMKYERRW